MKYETVVQMGVVHMSTSVVVWIGMPVGGTAPARVLMQSTMPWPSPVSFSRILLLEVLLRVVVGWLDVSQQTQLFGSHDQDSAVVSAGIACSQIGEEESADDDDGFETEHDGAEQSRLWWYCTMVW
eukprot:CAMPEP_0198111164 /NCGR_PEP_ID=MMETSP1442-20131203/3127_1 /TAXON_ID= /ORGANISM="Craspedostauros australis, Strain CCMP3328" /LENGTH=125 /DNA_ID=CAMNT_0043767497 /DNA_START=1163 /DNA_END=1540 /DNA_ORIENTATION=+